jgi:exosortase/archaeosortase family protein
MKRWFGSDRVGAAVLLMGAVAIWWRDTAWLSIAADALPLAAGIPIVVWLGSPWRPCTRAHGSPLSGFWPLVALFFFLVGWILPSVTLLSAAWTALVGCGIKKSYRPSTYLPGLLLILFFSFPWMVMEWPQIGWWFRISAASALEGCFHLLQMPVLRNGTELLVLGEKIRIEPACAGWNLLQLTLLAGAIIGLHDVTHPRRFLCFFALLPLLAWLSNFLRIALLSALSLSCGVATAEGVWHAITGLFVIVVVMGMAKLVCRVMESKRHLLICRPSAP